MRNQSVLSVQLNSRPVRRKELKTKVSNVSFSGYGNVSGPNVSPYLPPGPAAPQYIGFHFNELNKSMAEIDYFGSCT